jgi:hypothetical protein
LAIFSKGPQAIFEAGQEYVESVASFSNQPFLPQAQSHEIMPNGALPYGFIYVLKRKGNNQLKYPAKPRKPAFCL